MKNEGSNFGDAFYKVCSGIATIIGAICTGVFFCGTSWLPWKK